jgi:hypothetical protein
MLKILTKIFAYLILKSIHKTNKDSQHIQIRYNTKSDGETLPWRVISNGEEKLAQNVIINSNSFGEKTYIKGVAKYNIAVYGNVIWHKDVAIITN